METDAKEEKYSTNLKEVIYIPPDEEINKSQLLQAENEERAPDSYFLYVTAFTADLVAFATGCNLAWSSPALVPLKDPDPNINPLGEPVTSIQESWITALLFLGAAAGAMFAGKSADSLGRKKTLILVALPMLAAFIILAFARTVLLFYIARFAAGLGTGSTFAILPMYLGEITEDHNRGKFGSIMAIFVTLGVLYPFAVGPFLSLKILSFSCAIPLMLFLIFFYLFMPDSPVFLISKGYINEAKETLGQLTYKNISTVEKEILKMTPDIDNNSEKGKIEDLFKKPNLRKGIVVSLGLVISQQFGGINAVLGFMGQIFDASGSGISTYVSTVLVGLTQVLATLVTTATVEKLGRKFLLLTSSIGSSISILCLGLYFYLKINGAYNVDSLSWLPVTSLMVYIIAFNLGLGPLVWTVMGEIFPPDVKSIAASLTSSVCFFTSFGITFGFPILVESVGMAQCFLLFGFCCILASIFIYFIVPETKGKTLSQIQALLSNDK